MKFQTVVVPTDFRQNFRRFLSYIIQLANVRRVKIHLLHVVEAAWAPGKESVLMDRPIRDALVESASDRIRRLISKEQARRHGLDVTRHVTVGVPAGAILDYARAKRAALIVMGTHGASQVARVFALGGVTGKVLAASTKPVLVFPPVPLRRAAIRRVLCPTDFSATANKAFQAAVAIARSLGAELHVLHVQDTYTYGYPEDEEAVWVLKRIKSMMRKRAKKYFDGVLKRASRLDICCRVVEDPFTSRGIARYAKRAKIDLVVMGTRGESNLPKKILGSNTERLAWLSPCPLLAIPAGRGKSGR
jgi:nucleotide-binding universal stress UspA family protein